MELFEDKHWVGEFFVNNDYEKRFIGEINYSPENGVMLSYSIAGDKIKDEAKVVHGVLATGEKCTLIGKFDPQNSGFAWKNGLYVIRGKAWFLCLLVGDWLDENELIYDFNFSLTNMQEFFFPKGFKDRVKYSDKPLFNIKTNYGEIEVGNNARFCFLGKDISRQIYSRNENALEELKDSFEKVEKKYSDANFMLKEDISYRIYLKFDSGENITKAFKHIFDIANLFSMLIYGPVYPDSIYATKEIGKNQTISINIYPNMALNKRTMDLCIQERSHFNMPITNSNIDLASTIMKWLDDSKDYLSSTIVSRIQHETGYRNEHSIHDELVSHATQFEAISYGALKIEKKYDYPIDNYGTQKIKAGISKIFSKADESDIGKGIGNLRNEIAHVGKSKQLLKSLSIRDMVNINLYLQMTILGYILDGLGLDKSMITKYQDKFTPDV